MQAATPIANARRLLNDRAKVRWTDPDLIEWLNAGQRQIVAVRPDANAVRGDMTLAPGIEQQIPGGGIRLLSVLQNVGGRTVTLITRDEMDAINPLWMAATPKTVVRHYMHDADTPELFDVWPPVAQVTPMPKVRISYSCNPTDCSELSSQLDLDDIYEGPLTDFICYRAFSEDTDNPQNGARAADHIAAFMQALTGKTQADQVTQPHRKAP